jgi:hypothetical protein
MAPVVARAAGASVGLEGENRAMTRTKSIVVGATTFVGLHLLFMAAWQRWFGGSDRLDPWFLNSPKAVAATISVFAVVGAVSGLIDSRRDFEARAALTAFLATGGAVPMVIRIFTMRGGPGNLFPIVIVVGWCIMFLGAAIGVAVAWLVRRAGRGSLIDP